MTIKFKVLIFSAVFVLLAGCAVSDTVKISDENHYQVTVIGDVHHDAKHYHKTEAKTDRGVLKRAKNINQWQKQSPALLAAAAKESANTVPFVIQLGDLINGDCENAELQSRAMQTAFADVKRYFPGKKLFTVCGNHEYWGPRDVKKTVDDVFVPLVQKELGGKEQLSGTNYAVRYGKDLYIFYDLRPKGGAEFTRKTLAANSDARHIFFLTHLPIFPSSKGNPGWIVPDFKELIPLLAKHKAIVLCAHSHFWGHHIYQTGNDKLVQFMINSIGYNWTPGTPLQKYFSSYEDWRTKVNPKYFRPDNKWSIDNLKFFKKEDFPYYKSYKASPSGFVKIEVDGNRVLGHIYTDDSGKPVKTLLLKDGK